MKIVGLNDRISDQDRQLAVVRQHAMHEGWWDSPKRYQCINRNVVSMIQRNALFDVVVALCGGGDKVGIGIGGQHTNADGYYELNLNPGCAPGIWGDGRCLPFKNNSIDYITNSHVLEHIPDTLKTLTEWIRVLKPNGLIAITMPDKNHFAHDNSNPNHKFFDIAPSEMVPEELKKILDELDNVEILLFNTHLNNFDMEVLLRKNLT